MTHRLRAQRTCSLTACACLAAVSFAMHFPLADTASAKEISSRRLTYVVLAVRQARPSVVSIQGQKLVPATTVQTAGATAEAPRQVNGMGTGVIIDERGYILTKY